MTSWKQSKIKTEWSEKHLMIMKLPNTKSPMWKFCQKLKLISFNLETSKETFLYISIFLAQSQSININLWNHPHPRYTIIRVVVVIPILAGQVRWLLNNSWTAGEAKLPVFHNMTQTRRRPNPRHGWGRQLGGLEISQLMENCGQLYGFPNQAGYHRLYQSNKRRFTAKLCNAQHLRSTPLS